MRSSAPCAVIVEPSAKLPARMRAIDSLPPCGVCEVLSTSAALLGGAEPEAIGGRLNVRYLVPQRLEQAQDAIAVIGRAEQHGTDLARAQLLGEVVEHVVALGWLVRKQLLHQLVVVVGELLEHVKACLLLAIEVAGRHLDHLGGSVRAINEGTLECEVDEAGGDAVLPDRDLPQDERPGARRLQ